MAGDWIKMRTDLSDDPAVIAIAAKLDVDTDLVVGKLHRLWSWADRHTVNGEAPSITGRWVDKYVGLPGFSDAMSHEKWLELSDRGIRFPNFDRHNGESAKKRVANTLRQRLSREQRDSGATGEERGVIPRPFRTHVYERDGYTCVYCGEASSREREASRKAMLTIDHLDPATRGGTTTVDNLVCACRLCNSEKNDRTPEEWGLSPTHLQDGITFVSRRMCDSRATKASPEKRREEKKKTPLPPEGEKGGGGILKAIKARGIVVTDGLEHVTPAMLDRHKGKTGGLLRNALLADVEAEREAGAEAEHIAAWLAQRTPEELAAWEDEAMARYPPTSRFRTDRIGIRTTDTFRAVIAEHANGAART